MHSERLGSARVIHGLRINSSSGGEKTDTLCANVFHIRQRLVTTPRYQLARICIRQGTEEHSINHCKDRGVGPDPKGQRDKANKPK
jgi:hypothetical protein